MAEPLKTVAEGFETAAEVLEIIAEALNSPAEALNSPAEHLKALAEALDSLAEGRVCAAAATSRDWEKPDYLSVPVHPTHPLAVVQPQRLRPLFTCRLDELAPLARLLRASYVRDQPAFADLLPDDYTAAFLTDYDQHLQAVANLVGASVQQAKGMLFTQHIQALYDALPALLNRLAARVRRAEGLTVPATRFGIEPARQARNQQDREGLADDLKTLLQNIAANADALAKKGHKPAETQQLQDLFDALVQDSAAHGSNLSTQRQLTQDNAEAVRALSEPMQHLFADGKALYGRGTNSAKLADYTYRQLLKRLRREQPAGAPAAKDGTGAA